MLVRKQRNQHKSLVAQVLQNYGTVPGLSFCALPWVGVRGSVLENIHHNMGLYGKACVLPLTTCLPQPCDRDTLLCDSYSSEYKLSDALRKLATAKTLV